MVHVVFLGWRLTVLAFVSLICTGISRAEVWDYTANTREAERFEKADFRLWLPADHADRPVRGVLVLVPGFNGDGRGQATDPGWQKLAQEFDLATLGVYLKGGSPIYHQASKGSGDVLLQALEHFAQETNHPELEFAPLAMWGHSAGGQFNFNFACYEPKRVITFVVNKGAYYDDKMKGGARDIPAVFFLGENDSELRVNNITNLFDDNRKGGALLALVVEKKVGHGLGNSRRFAEAYFRTVIPERLPTPSAIAPKGKVKLRQMNERDAWLGNNETYEISPASSYSGKKKAASWLPISSLAEDWQKLNRNEY